MDRLTIIDGSSLIYSACHNVSRNEDKTDNFVEYKNTLDYYFNSILEHTKADKFIIYGDASSSYRKKMFATFKSNRIVNKQYIKFKYDLLEYAINEWGMYIHPDLESDDMCLITKNEMKSIYSVIIAAIDSDLRQEEGEFFNYGIFRKESYIIEDAFENITKEQASFNFHKSLLIQGHNHKVDYLEGCGEKSAEVYLSKFEQDRYLDAVLKAYINGITKEYGVKKNINGYGLTNGIKSFSNSFHQTYLFRTLYEVHQLGIEFTIPELRTLKKIDNDGGREPESIF